RGNARIAQEAFSQWSQRTSLADQPLLLRARMSKNIVRLLQCHGGGFCSTSVGSCEGRSPKCVSRTDFRKADHKRASDDGTVINVWQRAEVRANPDRFRKNHALSTNELPISKAAPKSCGQKYQQVSRAAVASRTALNVCSGYHSRQGGASCRSSDVRDAPLATVGPK